NNKSSELNNLKRKVGTYKDIMTNTRAYRDVWKNSLRDQIISVLEMMVKGCELDATVQLRSDMENLEAIVLSLGDVKSGIWQEIGSDIKRHMIKHNGSLIYQQLFNGKVIVLLNYPFIENYGQPRQPKTIGIYRPEELKEPFFIRHMEEFITDITNWEDYDDDEPSKKIGFDINFGNLNAGMDTPINEQ
ncbi:MAG: hypothetical protein ACI8P3_004086, partial [Saprospiraceae bacterium]